MKKLILLLLISCSYVQAAEQTQLKQCEDAWIVLDAQSEYAKYRKKFLLDQCDDYPSKARETQYLDTNGDTYTVYEDNIMYLSCLAIKKAKIVAIETVKKHCGI